MARPRLTMVLDDGLYQRLRLKAFELNLTLPEAGRQCLENMDAVKFVSPRVKAGRRPERGLAHTARTETRSVKEGLMSAEFFVGPEEEISPAKKFHALFGDSKK